MQSLNATVDLVIFDCDGVLVDSEVISCRAHAETLTRHGYTITADQVLQRFLGRSMRQATLEIEAELGRSLPEDFHTQVYAEIFRSFAESLEATPHVDEVLAAITRPVCVASSGPPEKISASLNRVGLYDRFAPHIFSAVQVRKGKPAPDLFLFAAEQMRTSPEAMPRDRRQCGWRYWRPRRRDDCARLSRRQPLPPGPCRDAARRRGHGDV